MPVGLREPVVAGPRPQRCQDSVVALPRPRGRGRGLGRGRAARPLLPSIAADCAACRSASGEPHLRPPVLGIGAGTGPGRYIITPAVEAPRSGYAVTRGDPGVMAACR